MISTPIFTPEAPAFGERGQKPGAKAAGPDRPGGQVCMLAALRDITVGLCAEHLFGEAQHQPGADDASEHSSQVAHQDRQAEAAAAGGQLQAQHEGGDDCAHTEGCAQVGESGKLIPLEVPAEAGIVCQGQNGRIVRQVSCDDSNGRQRQAARIGRP